MYFLRERNSCFDQPKIEQNYMLQTHKDPSFGDLTKCPVWQDFIYFFGQDVIFGEEEGDGPWNQEFFQPCSCASQEMHGMVHPKPDYLPICITLIGRGSAGKLMEIFPSFSNLTHSTAGDIDWSWEFLDICSIQIWLWVCAQRFGKSQFQCILDTFLNEDMHKVGARDWCNMSLFYIGVHYSTPFPTFTFSAYNFNIGMTMAFNSIRYLKRKDWRTSTVVLNKLP